MGKDVIIACDFAGKREALEFLDLFTDEKPYVKIGMELFYAEGPEIVREIKRRGHKIFLDLKLHDIPNTVMKAMSVLSKLDVDMCNVHAGGTIAMMEAADTWTYASGRHKTAFNCGYAAYFDRSGENGKRPSHRKTACGCGDALCQKRI